MSAPAIDVKNIRDIGAEAVFTWHFHAFQECAAEFGQEPVFEMCVMLLEALYDYDYYCCCCVLDSPRALFRVSITLLCSSFRFQ